MTDLDLARLSRTVKAIWKERSDGNARWQLAENTDFQVSTDEDGLARFSGYWHGMHEVWERASRSLRDRFGFIVWAPPGEPIGFTDERLARATLGGPHLADFFRRLLAASWAMGVDADLEDLHCRHKRGELAGVALYAEALRCGARRYWEVKARLDTEYVQMVSGASDALHFAAAVARANMQSKGRVEQVTGLGLDDPQFLSELPSAAAEAIAQLGEDALGTPKFADRCKETAKRTLAKEGPKKAGPRALPLEAWGEPAEEDPGMAALLNGDEASALFREALGNMTERQRQAWELWAEGLGNDEIAAEMKIDKVSVRVLLSQGRNRARSET